MSKIFQAKAEDGVHNRDNIIDSTPYGGGIRNDTTDGCTTVNDALHGHVPGYNASDGGL